MRNREWKPDTNAHIQRWVEEAAADGEIDLRAKRLGVSYGDAVISLAEELERPYKEIEEQRRKRLAAAAPGEEEIHRLATAYAEKHGCPYPAALDAVLLACSSPGAASRPVVELEEDAPERPCVVDEADAALNRRAEEHAKRKGCSYEAALDAVLEGEIRA